MNKPDVIFVFADQWRAQACGYAGNNQVKTPHLDVLAARGLNLTNAVANCPVCTPYRASLISGQYPLTHGLFLNDLRLGTDAVSIAQAFKDGGYDTAYVGKWHLDDDRDAFIPPERRQGFDYWKVRDCTHQYNDSYYYDQEDTEWKKWEGYDALAQTDDAIGYLKNRKDDDKPCFLVLSWGPPHNPYDSAPEEFNALYDPDTIELRSNVPAEQAETARKELAGYYAHCSALDHCMGKLVEHLKASGKQENTLLVFTSDHGDMIRSQGQNRKQKPWAESCRVPFLLHWPVRFGTQGKKVSGFLDAPDIMPTLLSLCGLDIPDTVEGRDFTGHLDGGDDPAKGRGLIACYSPFGEFERRQGGREYRAVVTERYTYAKTLDGPWLLYDDVNDPYQLKNLVDDPAQGQTIKELEAVLQEELERTGDEFLPGPAYIEKWGYRVNEKGTVDYRTKTG